jgi:hypothetical protein
MYDKGAVKVLLTYALNCSSSTAPGDVLDLSRLTSLHQIGGAKTLEGPCSGSSDLISDHPSRPKSLPDTKLRSRASRSIARCELAEL